MPQQDRLRNRISELSYRFEIFIAIFGLTLLVSSIILGGFKEQDSPWSPVRIDFSKIAQIAFFTLTGVLGVATYRNAKRSLFQPLKTEFFKLQLEALRRVTNTFQAKSIHEQRRLLGCDVQEDAMKKELLSDFVTVVLRETSAEFSPYRMEIGDAVRPYDTPSALLVNQARAGKLNSLSLEQRISEWKCVYKLSHLLAPKEHLDACRSIRALATDVALPDSVRSQVSDLYLKLNKRKEIFARFLAETSNTLPDKYHSVQDLKKIVDGETAETWINNVCAKRIANEHPDLATLSEDFDRVVESVRIYLLRFQPILDQ